MVEFRYTAPDRLQNQLNKRISELKTNFETAKQESEKQSILSAIENLRELINKIVVRGEPVGYVNIMIYVTAENLAELRSRIKRVQSALAVVECGTRPWYISRILRFAQWLRTEFQTMKRSAMLENVQCQFQHS